MLVEKPEDVRHENAAGNASAIYGVDAHPNKPLFATAGGDGSVKIWSLERTQGGDGVANFELLATLAFHEQAVNCVRWAGHGRYLASGSDDQLVLLYELQAGAPAPVAFGSNAKPNKQNWVRCSTLRRHTMDVQDVAWSPDDRLLATCSIDNTICIWDVDPAGISPVMNQPLQTLAGHNGWVKGVAWDPVGKYLASAGEDKTVRVWRVDNWQQAHVITEPFEACASTSHFRRLSWSPDGSVVCGTHAFKSKKNVAALLDRATWSNDVDFVGHQAVVTCARFHPKLFVKDPSSDKEYACCAVGGDDATISIWLAHMSRPLTVMKECFDASVTDLSWWIHENHSTVIVSSLDGSICCFQLDAGEIGHAVSELRQSKLLQTKYGARAGITLASTFVENPLQLQLEERSARKPAGTSTANALVPKKKMASASTAPPTSKPGTVNILQAVSKKGDKKRIAPVLLQQQHVGGPHAPEPASSSLESGSTTSEAPNAASMANKIQNILGPTVPENLGDTTLLDERMAGKPVNRATDTNGDGLAKASSETNVAAAASNGSTVVQSKTDAKKQRELSLKRKREGGRVTSGGATTAAGAAVMAKAKEMIPRPPKVLTQSGENGPTQEPLLPVFPLRPSFSVEIDAAAPNSIPLEPSPSRPANLIVEVTVHNAKGSGTADSSEFGPMHSTVRCSQDSNVKWIDRFPGQVVNVVGNATLCAIVTSTGDLFMLSSSGRRLFPCVALGGAVAVAECSPRKSPFLMIILASGVIKIWDVVARKLQLNDSVEGLVASAYATTQRVTLLRSTVSIKGDPMLTFAVANTETKGSASLHSYTFDAGMQAWMRVADDSFVYSDFHTTLSTETVTAREIPMGPLRRLQNASGFSRTQRGIASVMLKDIPDPITQRSVTRAHLEHQLAATIVVQSAPEYQYWLKAYVRFLAADEDVPRLEELCSELLGPFNHTPGAAADQPRWESEILDLSKRELLRLHVLPTMATNRMLQRVVAKYQVMLSEIKSLQMQVEADMNGSG